MSTKTKAELEAEIKSLKAELENKAKEEQYDANTREVHNIYTSYIRAGFTEEQAWELLTLTLKVNTINHKFH